MLKVVSERRVMQVGLIVDAHAEFISLVKRAANWTPFRVVNATKGSRAIIHTDDTTPRTEAHRHAQEVKAMTVGELRMMIAEQVTEAVDAVVPVLVREARQADNAAKLDAGGLHDVMESVRNLVAQQDSLIDRVALVAEKQDGEPFNDDFLERLNHALY